MKISKIIIHHSASNWGSAQVINRWHKERKYKGIGYHFVVNNGCIAEGLYLSVMDGSVETGRPLDGDTWMAGNEIGAHALGVNRESIGICVIGKLTSVKDMTDRQRASLVSLVRQLCSHYDIEPKNVLGHRETGRKTECPGFDVSILRNLLQG